MGVVGRVESVWRYPVKSMGGERLESAVAAALVADPLFDLAMALRRLLSEELVTGFSLASDESPTSL